MSNPMPDPIPASGKDDKPKRQPEMTGMSNRSEYFIWSNMLMRCHNPKNDSYYRYGGLGIHVCEAWRNSFAAFFRDMGPRPSPKHSIDRIDGSKGYEPGNVRWATTSFQNHNRRATGRTGIRGIETRSTKTMGTRYKAFIACNSKRYYLGSYGSAEEALAVYKLKSKELYGD